ncbi:DNA-dependent RNA polymerase subunit rpo22 [Salmon gill poxvirus]|nr:DNA-dependent RNA polymerase subunit rpo22 [Salmon gill poxvirus]
MDLQNSVKYLGNILSLKVVLKENPTMLVSSKMLRFCTKNIESIENLHRIDINYNNGAAKYSFYVTTSEKTITIPDPPEGYTNWPSVIRIGLSDNVLYYDPNTFGIKSLCFDVVNSSSMFIPFSPLTDPEQKKLLSKSVKKLQLPKMHFSELPCKICEGAVSSFKIMEFYLPNMDSGIEKYYRKIIY